MHKRGRFHLLALLALPVILAAFVACGGDTTPADDAPTGADAQVGSDPSETGTAPGDDTPAAEDPTATPSTETPTAPAQGTSSSSTERFISVSAGQYHTCGVRADGSVVCWGFDYTCQDVAGGGVVCTGSDDKPLPTGEFSSVSAGGFHTCGVKTNGAVQCWVLDEEDDDSWRGQADPPPGEFVSVSAGGFHTCGVKTDGAVQCWGTNEFDGVVTGQADPPPDQFASVSAGMFHTCGVRTDGTVKCWGANELGELVIGQAAPPSGEFSSVSAGMFHTCGVETGGAVECWGLNEIEGTVMGQATPPSGEFSSVSAGLGHTCGVKTDGSVECWGLNDDGEGNVIGQAAPPSGQFSSVSAGAFHTCGVRTGGSVECWGNDNLGQATPPGALKTGTAPADSTPTAGEPAGQTPTATPVPEAPDTSQASPDDYLAICGRAERAFEESLEESSSFKAFVARYGEVIELFESVEPPAELADWHDAMVVFLRAQEEVLDDAPGPGEGASPELVEHYAQQVLLPVFLQHVPGIIEIIKSKDDDTIARMIEADCIDQESLEGE